MKVTVNGASRTLAPGTTVAALVEEWGGGGKGHAVALNEEIVPRSRWGSTEIREGDRVEVLTAAQGG